MFSSQGKKHLEGRKARKGPRQNGGFTATQKEKKRNLPYGKGHHKEKTTGNAAKSEHHAPAELDKQKKPEGKKSGYYRREGRHRKRYTVEDFLQAGLERDGRKVPPIPPRTPVACGVQRLALPHHPTPPKEDRAKADQRS